MGKWITYAKPELDTFNLPIKLGIKRKEIGAWSFLSCGQPIVMEKDEIAQLGEIIRDWKSAFAGGVMRTLIQKRFGTHSIKVRIDYFNKQNYGVQVCEVEERPAGIAITCEINTQFRPHLMRLFASTVRAFGKPIAFCVSDARAGDSDDATFLKVYRWPGDSETGFHPRNIKFVQGVPIALEIKNYVWWVRALRNEEAYFDLEPHALSTISQEGDKEYGVPMGLWFKIGSNWRSVLPLERGCVLKPRYGSRFENSLIVQTVNKQFDGARNNAGIHSFQKAQMAIESGSVVYWQPFYPPERAKFLEQSERHLLRRAYFGFDFDSGEYYPMGGIWIAHDTVRIHGTTNALFGPLQLP